MSVVNINDFILFPFTIIPEQRVISLGTAIISLPAPPLTTGMFFSLLSFFQTLWLLPPVVSLFKNRPILIDRSMFYCKRNHRKSGKNNFDQTAPVHFSEHCFENNSGTNIRADDVNITISSKANKNRA